MTLTGGLIAPTTTAMMTMSNLGAEKRKVRKNLQQMYQSVVNRRQARAIAFRPQSEEGQRAWTTYLSLSSSSQE